MAGVISGDGMEKDFRRISSNTDFSCVLQSCGRIRKTFQTHCAFFLLRHNGKSVRPIVQLGRSSLPMLLVVVALGQRPNLVASVVDPAARRFCRRNILSFELWVNK